MLSIRRSMLLAEQMRGGVFFSTTRNSYCCDAMGDATAADVVLLRFLRRILPRSATAQNEEHKDTRHILTNQRTTNQTQKTMPPRVESFASLSRSIDSTESVKGGKSFQSFLVGSRDASSPTASSTAASALPSAELRTMIENPADRRGYVTAPTPTEHMPRLSNLSENGPQLYVKRDDVS